MSAHTVVVVGCSAGGLRALQAVLSGLDNDIAQAIVVCAHTGSVDVTLLCELLARHTAMPVVEAGERMMVTGGVVHVAPSGYHLLIEPSRHFALSVDPRVEFSRPSIDVLFDSAAEVYGPELIGVVLTGANRDGADGLAHIRRCGGLAIVQSPDSAEADVMPAAALAIAGTDYCVSLDDIAPLLNRLCRL
jgi:two-component system, chemotaxis family, protein-glutamate methylesterase/glutaminase